MSRGLAEVLRKVDPSLKVIESRPWPGKRKQKNGRHEWEKANGVNCNGCGQEVFRCRNGLCMPCWEKANEFEIRDKTGVLGLLPESVIMAIARPGKKES